MKQDEIIEMARQAGFIGNVDIAVKELETFAKLVEDKEREKWSDIVVDQRLRLQVLNEIIGGEDSTTTGNILSYSRWEMRVEDAVKEEREACIVDIQMHIPRSGRDTLEYKMAMRMIERIRARGEEK